MHKMLHKVFECEPPCTWNGHNKVLFKNLLEGPAKPDAYLVTMTHEQSGGIDKDPNGAWLHNSAQLISFSECRDQQEVMVVMPAFSLDTLYGPQREFCSRFRVLKRRS
jgi:hypothetical protein